jgi:hypothetical protein
MRQMAYISQTAPKRYYSTPLRRFDLNRWVGRAILYACGEGEDYYCYPVYGYADFTDRCILCGGDSLSYEVADDLHRFA